MVCSYHFTTNVLVETHQSKQRNMYDYFEPEGNTDSVDITVEQLAAIYGIDYVPPKDTENIIEENPIIIYLDQTQVIVKAVSRLGEKYFVVVDYLQQGETVRKKLVVGDQLLSYRLIGIDKSALHFEDQTKKSLIFSIFKKSKQ